MTHPPFQDGSTGSNAFGTALGGAISTEMVHNEPPGAAIVALNLIARPSLRRYDEQTHALELHSFAP